MVGQRLQPSHLQRFNQVVNRYCICNEVKGVVFVWECRGAVEVPHSVGGQDGVALQLSLIHTQACDIGRMHREEYVGPADNDESASVSATSFSQ